MDEQRAWIRSRRKRRLRLTAAILAVCLLVTTYPDILEAVSVFAAETVGEDENVSVSDTVNLPEEEDAAPSEGDGDVEEAALSAGDDNGEETVEDGAGSAGQEDMEESDIGEADTVTEDEEEQDAQPEESEEEAVDTAEIDETVQEKGEDAAIQALLTQIGALPEAEEYLAKEPDIDNWNEDDDAYEETYAEWMEGLSAYAEEALAIWEAYEALTEEQQMQIPEKALHKLTAWVEIAEQFSENDKVMAAADSGTDGNLTWKIENRTLTISGSGEMKNHYKDNGYPWYLQSENGEIDNIIVGDGVTRITDWAFGYTKAKTVTIAGSVEVIARTAFWEADFTDVTYKGRTPPSGCKDSLSSACYVGQNYKIHIPCDVTGDTRSAYAIWYDSARIIDTPHDYEYTASGAVITETCSNGCGHSATAKLSLKSGVSLTYTGSEIKPVTVTYDTGWAGTGANKPDASNISYSNNTDAGTATAKLTISGAEASLNFTIAKATMNVSAEGYTGTYDAQAHGITVTAPSGAEVKYGTTSGSYTSTTSPTYTDVGTRTVYYQVTKDNYTTVTGSKEVKIEAKPLTDAMITVADGRYYFTGDAMEPAVTVKDGTTALTAGTDYTVSYKDNVNPGTATVTIAGKGNYKGTFNKTFTIEYKRLPEGESLTDYVTIMPEPTDGWYNADITLTIKEGVGGVGTTPEGIGSSATVTKETGKDGDTQTVYIKDSEGNIYQMEFSYKLDKTPPVIDLTNMSVVNGTKTLWSWIVGKKSMVIKIPASDITDAHCGIAEVTYTATPDSGTEQTGTISPKGSYYEIALNAEFTGTIKLTAKDNAGNTTQVSLTAEGGKVIAEDYAPVVTITLPDTPTPNENGWYTTGFAITVTVTDDKDSGSAAITSGGIAEIKWKDGEDGTEQTVSGLPGAAPIYEKEFTITAVEGTNTYYVKAVDNAGNESGWQTVTVSLDTTAPVFSVSPAVGNHTQHGADIAFTPSEGGKVYWIVDAGETPDAREAADKGAESGNEKGIAGGTQETFTVGGFQAGTTHKVYVVLEDVAGNLSEVKEVSFTTLQAAPEITLEDLDIDHEKETIKIPDSIGKVEVYTDPSDPSGSKIQPEADGSLPVEPGTSIYIRYPEKTDGGETTPPSGSVKIDIPDRPTLSAKKVTVTDTTAKVTDTAAGEEYVLVKKGQMPDWSEASTTGAFTGLDPNTEYDLYARKKATDTSFVSDPVKTEARTLVTIKEPVITGDGKGKDGNTAPGLDVPYAEAGGNVTFTGTYGEEYTPVIIVGGQEMNPGAVTTWNEGSGKGGWEYTLAIPEDAKEAGITVEFRKRTITGIAVTPGTLTIYADHAANESIDALTSYLKENSSVQAVYDNKSKDAVQAEYTTADSFTVKGRTYSYTVSAGGKTGGITLKVASVNAALTTPAELMKTQKADGYTAEEVAAWLPAQVTVTYTGDGYKARTENREVTWRTDAIGADFGKTLGRKTISGTVALPAWATGQDSVSIGVEFVDRLILSDSQMKLSISGWIYGEQTAPAPQGSITVTDTNPVYTYLYSADNGKTWVEAQNLPKSESGNIMPGGYQVKMTYRGDTYTGVKTASFAVAQKPLTVEKGTLEVENRNYDGTTDATLKEGGEPALSGVVEGDTVTPGGTLSAVFTKKGPGKNIPVTVSGFELEGRDAGYYELNKPTLTLYATINNADGTPPSGGSGGNGGGGNDDDGNGGDGDGGDNGGSTPGDDKDPGTPPVTPPEDKTKPDPGTEGTPDKETETQPEPQPDETPKQDEEPENKDNRPKPESEQQPENVTEQTVKVSVEGGRIVVSGGMIETGNITETSETTTKLSVGDGAVIVTVVCEEEGYAAGVKDTVAVANAVLTPEQIQLVNDGETIEVRIDVKDISGTVGGQDKEVIEKGLAAYQNEIPELTLGMYVDISMFIRLGEGEWDAVTSTKEPIEVIIGIPTELLEEGREFYIIRSHEGEYTLLNDVDNDPDTVTISTNLFSAYAIAFKQVDTDQAQEGNTKCGLCHICPTFLGICCFIWLAVIAGVIIVVVIVILRRKKEKEKA